MTDDPCAFCGQSGDDVRMFSPDMDLKSIPLCLIDLAILAYNVDSNLSPTKKGRDMHERLARGD